MYHVQSHAGALERNMANHQPALDESCWNWRPQTYDDPSLAKVCNIFGTVRRRMAWDHFADGGSPPPDFVYAEQLDPHDREMWTRLAPANWGGEFLPPMEPGEIEIARVELRSTTGDVYSIRARKDLADIRYRVVDENEGEFKLPFDRSGEPLSVRDLVRLLEETRFAGYEEPGLVRPFWVQQVEYGDQPEDAVCFASVRSVLYEPHVTRIYEHFAADFVREHMHEQSGPDFDAPTA
jgi:hypothetical protein